MNIERIVEKYKKTFSFLSGKEIHTDLILKINSFKNYIDKQCKTNLEVNKIFFNFH